MLTTGLIITGSVVAVGVRRYQTNQQKYEFTKVLHKIQKHEKAQKHKKAQKPRFSLYNQITAVSKRLKLHKLLPTSRQTKDPRFQINLSPWEGKVTNKERQSADSGAQISSKPEYSRSDDLARFGRYISKYWRPYWAAGLFSGACLISFSIYETALSYALKVIVDGVITTKSLAMAVPIGSALLISFPIVVMIVIVGERVAARIGSRVISDMQYDIFEHLQNLSLAFHKQTKLGDILARFSSDMFFVRLGIGSELIPAIAQILTVTINIAFLFWFEWHLALISLLSLPLAVYVLQEFSPQIEKTGFELKKQEALVIHAVQEGVRAQAMVKSFTIDKFMQDCFLRELNKLEDKTSQALFCRAMFDQASVISLFLSQLFSTSVGLLLLGSGYISVGTLVSFIMIQNLLHQHIRKLIRDRIQLLILGAVGLRRVDLLFQNPIDIVDAVDAIELSAFNSAIRFENVSFSYTGESYQLDQMNLTIEAGQFVAFVGPSGAGKSTILNLILRFTDVSEGRVTIDGLDIRQVTQASLRAQMGIVLQDTFVFNASILDNIRVVKPNATEQEVIAAAKAAELHDFIISLPDGYQSSAGEAGGRLSGGQKQRVGIARAMLCNPAILILDEATSSLDAETAAAINKTISELAKDRTVISISHHLASVTEADKIFVLEQGRVVEEGTHEELLSHFGLYAQMWHTQTTSLKRVSGN